MDLSYRDERDRCYGATGMAIGIVVVNGEDYLASITIDGPAEDMIQYAPEFYVTHNPRLSAKTSWNQLLRSYHLSMSAVLGNALCRALVLDGMPVRYEVKQQLHDILADEGRQVCALEDDEIEQKFDSIYNHLHRIFNHRGVQSVAHDFAETLASRRTLSRLEILENLKALSMF